MSTEINAFQFALARCEQEIASIDAQMATLSGKRATLLNTRAALLRQLGQPVLVDISPSAMSSLDEDDGLTIIPRNAFRNMRVAEAARKYLLMVGRPVTHPELVNALLKGKVLIGRENASEHIRTALKRRTDWFVWTPNGKRGVWTLVEWPRPSISSGIVEQSGLVEASNLPVVSAHEAPSRAPA